MKAVRASLVDRFPWTGRFLSIRWLRGTSAGFNPALLRVICQQPLDLEKAGFSCWNYSQETKVFIIPTGYGHKCRVCMTFKKAGQSRMLIANLFLNALFVFWYLRGLFSEPSRNLVYKLIHYELTFSTSRSENTQINYGDVRFESHDHVQWVTCLTLLQHLILFTLYSVL